MEQEQKLNPITIKSFTDIEQSCKLAKILPLESADMYYEEVCNLPKAIVGNYILHNQNMEDKDYKKLSNPVLSPAWSLAALLDILPTIDDRNAVFCKDIRCDKWHVFYHGTATLPLIDTERHPDIIDACVAMIIKLHEQNLL